MGAGSSVPSLKKAMHDPEAARKIFDDMDANHDTELTVVELYDATRRYGEQISAEWTLDLIKATVERFDANGDGKINLEEFQTALDNLVAVKAPKGGGKRKSLKGSTGNLKATLKRAWTFKKLPTNMQDLISDAVEADAHDKEDEAEQAQADAMAMAMAPAMTIEEKEAKFWEVQEAQACWKVPFGLNRDRMPWAKDGETGLSLAIARARQQGKTPLLVDPSFDMICDRHYTAEEHGHKVLKARAMFEDEAQKKRTHGEVMNESRKLIVEAMREGKTFYIQLEKKVRAATTPPPPMPPPPTPPPPTSPPTHAERAGAIAELHTLYTLSPSAHTHPYDPPPHPRSALSPGDRLCWGQLLWQGHAADANLRSARGGRAGGVLCDERARGEKRRHGMEGAMGERASLCQDPARRRHRHQGSLPGGPGLQRRRVHAKED